MKLKHVASSVKDKMVSATSSGHWADPCVGMNLIAPGPLLHVTAVTVFPSCFPFAPFKVQRNYYSFLSLVFTLVPNSLRSQYCTTVCGRNHDNGYSCVAVSTTGG